MLRRGSAEVTAESALRGARASAELEGAGIELERLRGQLMGGGTVTLPSKDERGALLVQGAVRLHADLGQLLVPWRHSPRQALARLHVLAAADLVDDPDALGRPRPPASSREDPLGLGPGARAGRGRRPPRRPGPGAARPARRAPAVVVAAVVHGELMALRAFGTADGLVARAAARLVLVDRGLDPKAVSAPEVGHVELGRRRTGSRRDGDATPTRCARTSPAGRRASRPGSCTAPGPWRSARARAWRSARRSAAS